jgi:hypothetical protein
MSLERHFRKFTAGPALAKQKRIHVTLRPDGVIYLNQNVYRMMGQPGAVALYYSDETDTIAIEPADPRSNEHFPLLRKGKTGWEISSGNFCGHYELRPKQTQQFVRPEINNDGILLLNMRETINSTPRPHKKRRGA